MRSIVHAVALFGLSTQAFAGTALPVTSVPTLSEWSMLSLGGALVAAGFYIMRKKK